MFETNFTELFELVKTGRLFEVAGKMWLSALDVWFVVFLYIILLTPLYFKTRSIVPPALVSILLNSILITMLPPQVHVFLYAMILFAVVAIFYRLFTR